VGYFGVQASSASWKIVIHQHHVRILWLLPSPSNPNLEHVWLGRATCGLVEHQLVEHAQASPLTRDLHV
jgi:hypothetical protein